MSIDYDHLNLPEILHLKRSSLEVWFATSYKRMHAIYA